MAIIHHPESGRRLTLSTTTVVGRGGARAHEGDLVIDNLRISSTHANFLWRHRKWWIRDTASRNGTQLNGKRLNSRDEPLRPGDVITFGGSGGSTWVMEDALPPRPRAIRLSDNRAVEDDANMLALPDPGDPRVIVFTDARGRWLAEEEGAARVVADQDVVDLDGESWRLSLPTHMEDIEETLVTDSQGNQGLLRSLKVLDAIVFSVSADEEHVEVALRFPIETLPLPSRTFHYTLLTLARARLAEEDPSSGDAGWMYVEDLCDQLATIPNHLNVEVYRARQLLAGLGVKASELLVERRRHTRQLRLGVHKIEIKPI